jgi:LysM repeat protein
MSATARLRGGVASIIFDNMISLRRFHPALAALLAAMLAGCLPAGTGQDEEKEAHFQTGRARVNGMDYGGAIEAFQKALEVNPHSGAAHFELGWLYADKQPDPAAAIYHYEQYLALRPTADNAETIRQHIFRLKQDLAKAVLPLPSTPGVQRQLEQLMEENRRLHEEVEKWRADYANRGVAPPTNPPSGAVTRPFAPGSGTPLPPGGPGSATGAQNNRPPPVAPGTGQISPSRTHKVQAGETPSGIARKYNVKLEALMAANPGLNPKRLQVGQSLNVPAS